MLFPALCLLFSLPLTTSQNTSITPFPSDPCALDAYPAFTIASPGKPYTPQLPTSELVSILNEVSPERIGAIIEKLAAFGTRHTQSDQSSPTRGIGAARDWLLAEYQSFAAESEGWMIVDLQSYIQPAGGRLTAATNISNVVATLKGSSDPDRIIVVSYVTLHPNSSLRFSPDKSLAAITILAVPMLWISPTMHQVLMMMLPE